MLTTFSCSNCDAIVSFTAKDIKHHAVHSVTCPHCHAANRNDAINNLANTVGNRFRRKFTGDNENMHILIRNEPVEDVNHAMETSFVCSTCKKEVCFSPIKILSHVEHTITCPICSTRNGNASVDAQGISLCNSFIVINTEGKLLPKT
ncbi:hypothetical protein ACQ0P8_04555 [Halodesulfovibrio aestuarii]|uniref:C2H2-type domain-containing protein n=1 Tax=Halodesulfovibrio aestuarii TaxID=126333 RepID=A0A8G2FA70_9BACT|nr:hypothetical protein [Halodesulfovibrio aestuarii]SHI77319.1 hypothetical protein SAMN05660830_00938 [Halodesulfovibrio aestuarii]